MVIFHSYVSLPEGTWIWTPTKYGFIRIVQATIRNPIKSPSSLWESMGPRSFNQGVVRSVSRACIQYFLAKQTCKKKHLGVKQGNLFFSLAEIDIACIACIGSLWRENRFTKTANWTSDLTVLKMAGHSYVRNVHPSMPVSGLSHFMTHPVVDQFLHTKHIVVVLWTIIGAILYVWKKYYEHLLRDTTSTYYPTE